VFEAARRGARIKSRRQAWALDDAQLCESLVARFVAHGVPQHSVICMGSTSRTDHLSSFENIDISLDPFPQNGGVSTWESLHMGVPLVAKLGNTLSSRVAGCILRAIGLDDWVADDEEGYLSIAQKVAGMPDHLETLRRELPARISASAAGNGEIYTRCVEAGYRQFWRAYCASRTGDPFKIDPISREAQDVREAGFRE
jgi:predicted O-linked N-acetylglucosamine transferase (SPINDLY family)